MSSTHRASQPNDALHAPRENRLGRESSPYLRQHARNPVDWFPWGDEAFAEARRRDVPIFLSIGYSTCYWCHVMERESFENDQIARRMNESFVCVKVDREERPDVDDLYMAAVQAMTRSGGWPMSVFLEPRSLKPFWCGTYFPPDSRYGRPGFPQVLAGIAEAWKTQREVVLKQAEELGTAVKEQVGEHASPAPLSDEQVAHAAGSVLRMHDRTLGGFGSAPKFPQPCYLEFLLTFRPYAGDDDTRQAVDAALKVTLDRMATGGIFDHVGGGFHRYSTDSRWLVPHFEKMLYDQGQLAMVYAWASRVFDDAFYARTARRTCECVLRELRSAETESGDSAFFSALDAEVNHREGQNYLWTAEQLNTALGADDAAWAAKALGVAPAGTEGNFRDPHHPDEPASNVLSLSDRPAAVAATLGVREEEFLHRLDRVCAALYAARARRDQPGRDEKILTAWNGLMIAGLATAGATLNEPEFVRAGESAARFVLRYMREPQGGPRPGGLLRSCVLVNDGGKVTAVAKIPAFLDDYACFIRGLIELHRTGRDTAGDAGAERGFYLREARRLIDEAEARFGTAAPDAAGAFYDTLADQTDLFVRARSQYDGAIPSGSSMMLNNLLDLYEMTGDATFARRAGSLLAAMSAFVAASPVGGINSARGLLRALALEPRARAMALAALPAGPAPGAGEAPGSPPQPVAIYSAADEVTVAAGEPAGLVLKMRIDEGYHVNAAEPGLGLLVGLRVKIVNGSGVTAYADYPPGEEYRPAWARETEQAGKPEGGAPAIRVYKGEVSIPVILERTGDWKGRPLLAVTYQACNDAACLAPVTVELDVAIDRR